MFDIEYKGGNAVTITTKKTRLVIDPRLSLIGMKDLNVKDAVEIATEARFATDGEAAKLQIEGPGEYEIGDVSIRGVQAYRHIDTETDELVGTMYRIEIGDVRLAILGNVAPKLSDDQLEAIGIVDGVILPVGGSGYTLDATSAATIVRSIDPKVVIPVHYADDALKYEVPQDELDVFVKELATSIEDAGSKYKIKSASALPQTLTIIKIDRS